jgi:hypothetical protein
MKREEKIANDYFISEGFNKIQHEPDGNIPPDFLLNDSIAVEVVKAEPLDHPCPVRLQLTYITIQQVFNFDF